MQDNDTYGLWIHRLLKCTPYNSYIEERAGNTVLHRILRRMDEIYAVAKHPDDSVQKLTDVLDRALAAYCPSSLRINSRSVRISFGSLVTVTPLSLHEKDLWRDPRKWINSLYWGNRISPYVHTSRCDAIYVPPTPLSRSD